jgi:ATP-dependent Clp protease protease subunit
VAVEEARARGLRAAAEIAECQLAATKLDLAGKQDLYDQGRATGFYHRIYTFGSSIRGDSVGKCLEILSMWHRLYPGEQFTILLYSQGGELLPGLALFDALKLYQQLGHAVHIRVMGYAASMAAVVLQAATWRVIGRESLLLLHEISGQASGSLPEMRDYTDFLAKIQSRLIDIFLERMAATSTRTEKMDRQEFERRWQRQDWWVSAPEALALGLVDEVV